MRTTLVIVDLSRFFDLYSASQQPQLRKDLYGCLSDFTIYHAFSVVVEWSDFDRRMNMCISAFLDNMLMFTSSVLTPCRVLRKVTPSETLKLKFGVLQLSTDGRPVLQGVASLSPLSVVEMS